LGGSKLFGDLALEIVRTLNPSSKTQEYTTLDCAIYNVKVKDGVATIENIALQTDRMAIVVLGKVNLGSERLDLSVQATPREGLGISIGGVVNSFLKLGGTLRNPKLRIDPTGSVTTYGAAVATGGLSLLAKGLWDRAKASVDICEDLAQEEPGQ
jgi:autotransporter translocation and assembly factor TamB